MNEMIKMSKKSEGFYFCDEFDTEKCHTLRYITNEMAENGLSNVTIYRAEKINVDGYFYCIYFGDVSEKFPTGDGCGRNCIGYIPRNKKNGCCKNFGSLYGRGEAYDLTYNGKTYLLTKKNNKNENSIIKK